MRLPFNLGEIYVMPKMDPAEELEKYRHAVAATPEDGIARFSLAAWLHTAGLYDEAIREYQEAIRLLIAFPPKAAEPRFDRFHQLSRLAHAHDLLARAFHERGHTEAAIPHWEQALAFHERYSSKRWLLGDHHVRRLRKTLSRARRAMGNKSP